MMSESESMVRWSVGDEVWVMVDNLTKGWQRGTIQCMLPMDMLSCRLHSTGALHTVDAKTVSKVLREPLQSIEQEEERDIVKVWQSGTYGEHLSVSLAQWAQWTTTAIHGHHSHSYVDVGSRLRVLYDASALHHPPLFYTGAQRPTHSFLSLERSWTMVSLLRWQRFRSVVLPSLCSIAQCYDRWIILDAALSLLERISSHQPDRMTVRLDLHQGGKPHRLMATMIPLHPVSVSQHVRQTMQSQMESLQPWWEILHARQEDVVRMFSLLQEGRSKYAFDLVVDLCNRALSSLPQRSTHHTNNYHQQQQQHRQVLYWTPGGGSGGSGSVGWDGLVRRLWEDCLLDVIIPSTQSNNHNNTQKQSVASGGSGGGGGVGGSSAIDEAQSIAGHLTGSSAPHPCATVEYLDQDDPSSSEDKKESFPKSPLSPRRGMLQVRHRCETVQYPVQDMTDAFRQFDRFVGFLREYAVALNGGGAAGASVAPCYVLLDAEEEQQTTRTDPSALPVPSRYERTVVYPMFLHELHRRRESVSRIVRAIRSYRLRKFVLNLILLKKRYSSSEDDRRENNDSAAAVVVQRAFRESLNQKAREWAWERIDQAARTIQVWMMRWYLRQVRLRKEERLRQLVEQQHQQQVDQKKAKKAKKSRSDLQLQRNSPLVVNLRKMPAPLQDVVRSILEGSTGTESNTPSSLSPVSRLRESTAPPSGAERYGSGNYALEDDALSQRPRNQTTPRHITDQKAQNFYSKIIVPSSTTTSTPVHRRTSPLKFSPRSSSASYASSTSAAPTAVDGEGEGRSCSPVELRQVEDRLLAFGRFVEDRRAAQLSQTSTGSPLTPSERKPSLHPSSKGSHTKFSPASPSKVFDEKRAAALYERHLRGVVEHEEKVKRERERLQSETLQDVTFSPKISRTSERLMKSTNQSSRMEAWAKQRQSRMEQLKEQLERDRMEKEPHQPKLPRHSIQIAKQSHWLQFDVTDRLYGLERYRQQQQSQQQASEKKIPVRPQSSSAALRSRSVSPSSSYSSMRRDKSPSIYTTFALEEGLEQASQMKQQKRQQQDELFERLYRERVDRERRKDESVLRAEQQLLQSMTFTPKTNAQSALLAHKLRERLALKSQVVQTLQREEA